MYLNTIIKTIVLSKETYNQSKLTNQRADVKDIVLFLSKGGGDVYDVYQLKANNVKGKNRRQIDVIDDSVMTSIIDVIDVQ